MNHSTESNKITILVADDHPLLRQALRTVLEREHDIEVIGEASDGEETVQIALDRVPDIVILDISMPRLNGIAATRTIKTNCSTIAVLVLTVHDDAEHILSILEAGAAGYLTKSVFGPEVVHAVRSVVAGDTVLSPMVSQRIIKHALRYVTKPIELHPAGRLSGREVELLRLAALGLSNKDIADRLEVSVRTVKGRLEDIFSKLNVASRTEAVITALHSRLISIDDLG